ncbi:UNKNOWN [Stylonychia lemnae]|uniref:Transmembrane protein n=1 Tax=Stylonychia lemnae TaxID=5949 RepID=A0A077ZTI7_STYLE|nr:UNKNOWN [Stylonychia lemnae]|eukprot:CDW72819.1 UNKNOWN [Stylonychia lemnae]
MLKIVYYGQAVICFVKFIQYGGLAGIFQLINLWVIYSAFATMHFCSVLIYLIMCIFDLLFAVMDWKKYETKNSEDPDKESSIVMQFLFIVQIVYFIIAIYFSYRAYSHFKILFFIQLGRFSNGANREFDDTDSDEERDSQYQREQRVMRENFIRQQQLQLRNAAAAQGGLNHGIEHRAPAVQQPLNQSQQQHQQQVPYQPPSTLNHIPKIIHHDFTQKPPLSQQRQQTLGGLSSIQSQQTQNQNMNGYPSLNNLGGGNNNSTRDSNGSGFTPFGGQGHRLQ